MPSASMGDLFDSAFLARLEYLALVAKRIARGDLRAEHVTKMRGSGIQFADFRPYRPGDDFRYVDWNAYARLGQLLLKMFEEEQDLHVYLLLDTSRSMDAGEPSKLAFAKQLVAALAYITLSNLDRAGISLVGSGLVHEVPAARGKGRIMSLLRYLDAVGASDGDTDLGRAAEQFLHRPRRKGVVVVISDLFDRAGYRAALDRLRFSRHQMALIHVVSPADRAPKLKGDVDLVDAETRRVVKATVTERSLARYGQVFDAFMNGVAGYGTHHEVPVVQVMSDADLESVVLYLFRRGGLVRS